MPNLNILNAYSAYPLRVRILLAVLPIFFLAYLIQPFKSSLRSDFDLAASDSVIYDQAYQYPSEPHHAAIAQLRPKRVLIVGAGASGSAAAFFLRRAARIMEERIGVDEGRLVGDIVVIDKEGYVGGRKSSSLSHGMGS